MDLEPIRQKAEFDASQFIQQIGQLERQVAGLQEKLNNVGKTPNVSAAQRGLLALQSSLGGAERAAAQMAVAEQRLKAAVDAGIISTQRAAQLRSQMASTFSAAAVGARDLRTNMAGLNTTMAGVTRGFFAFRNVLATLGVGLGARELLSYADAYTTVQNALRITGTATADLTRETEGLFTIANETRQPIEAIATLYQRLSLVAGEVGASQQDVLQFVELVGKSLAVQGSSATQSAGALLQLAQAMGGATIQAQEFNSLIDGAPVLLRAAAAGMEGVGGSVAELQRRVKAQEVSNVEFFQSILRGAGLIESQFSTAVVTVGSALVNLRNSMIELVGGTDQAVGGTSRLAGSLEDLSDALREPGIQNFATDVLTVMVQELANAGTQVGALVGLFGELRDALLSLPDIGAFGEGLARKGREVEESVRGVLPDIAERELERRFLLPERAPGELGAAREADIQADIAAAEQRLEQQTRAAATAGLDPGDSAMVQETRLELERLTGVLLEHVAAREALARVPLQVDIFKAPGKLREGPGGMITPLAPEAPRPPGAEDVARARQGEAIRLSIEADEEAARNAESASKKAAADELRAANQLAADKQRFVEAFDSQLRQLTGSTIPEIDRLMADLTAGLDFEPPPSQLADYRAQFEAAIAIRDAEEERLAVQERIKDAMREQAEAAEELRMMLPGARFMEETRQLESRLAFMQTPAAGPQQITAEQAGQIRFQARQQMELPPGFSDLADVTGGTLDAFADFTAELAVGKTTLADFGEVMSDVAQMIMRAALEAMVTRPLTEAATAGLAGVAAQVLGAGAAGAVGGGGFGAPAMITPGGTPITIPGPAAFGTGGTTPGGTPIFIPRQHGGPVSSGRPYLVGEAGPEVFRPKTSGDIIPLGAHLTPRQFGGKVMAREAVLAGEAGPELFAPRGAARGGGRAPSVEMHTDVKVINEGGAKVTPSVRQGAGGRQMIEVLVQDAMAANARGGQLDPIFQSFGGRRRGVQRS